MTATALTVETRTKALVRFLNEQYSDKTKADDVEHVRENDFRVGNREYSVYTEEEADKAAKDYILDSVWAFRPEFLIYQMNVNDHDGTLKALKAVQEKCCESCNDLLRAALKDEDEFVKDAISADGRGHFLNPYDGEEHMVKFGRTWFYIYRRN